MSVQSLLLAVPPNILLPLPHCMLPSTPVYTDVLPDTNHPHILYYIYEATADTACRSQRMVFLVSTYSTKGLSRQTSEELQLPGMLE